MEGIENAEAAQPDAEPVEAQSAEDTAQAAEPVEEVPGNSDVTEFPEDDDPEANVGDVAE